MTSRLFSFFTVLVSTIILSNYGISQTTFPANAKIMCLGDSRVEGDPTFESYRYEFWKDLVDCNWTFDLIGEEFDPLAYPAYQGITFDPDHQGSGGSTTSDILTDLPFVLSSIGSIDIVLLGIGGNDLLNNGSSYVSTAIANINSIIDLLQIHNPNIIILVEQIAPGMTSIMTPDATLAVSNFNSEIQTLSTIQNSGGSTVIAVDMNTGWQDSYLVDDTHYNSIGAEIVATRYSNALKTLFNCGVAFTPEIEINNIEFYPNPANSILNIEIPHTLIPFGMFEIQDIAGKSLLSRQIHHNEEMIDVSKLKPGNYIALFSNHGGMKIRKKLIIQ
ncbi:MAG: GDSL-type esterase/lipase family protein [Crocinitomicaceae bacterium]|nr:GDSL-type esterase/lipase family protein [Crocinitomicaceae bacterium]